jgi:hypothetical protein
MSDFNHFNSIQIFYQNLRGLRNKCNNFFDIVCVNDYKIICITETWLHDSFCNRNVFPDNYFVFRADRDCTDSKLTRGGGVLTAVLRSLSSCKRRYDLTLIYECVLIEIPIPGGFNLLVVVTTTSLLTWITNLLKITLIYWKTN